MGFAMLKCPHCGTKVVPTAGSMCPSCRKPIIGSGTVAPNSASAPSHTPESPMKVGSRSSGPSITAGQESEKNRLINEFLHKLANAAVGIGQFEDRLAAELVAISLLEGFLNQYGGAEFNEDHRNIRAREIGKELYEKGGIQLMLQVRELVARARGGVTAHELDWAWHGIGEWLA